MYTLVSTIWVLGQHICAEDNIYYVNKILTVENSAEVF